MSKHCPAACTDGDCNDGIYTASYSLPAGIRMFTSDPITSISIAPKHGPCHNFTCFSTHRQTEQKTKITGTQHSFKLLLENALIWYSTRRTRYKSRTCQEDSCSCVIWRETAFRLQWHNKSVSEIWQQYIIYQSGNLILERSLSLTFPSLQLNCKTTAVTRRLRKPRGWPW